MARRGYPVEFWKRVLDLIEGGRRASTERLKIVLNLAEGLASGPLVLPAGSDPGGASGGPLFLIHEEPVVTFTIAGFNL